MLYAVDKQGNVVQPGDKLIDFRGEEWTFRRPLSSTDPGHAGKVMVERPRPGTSTVLRVFYATVFGLVVHADLPVRRA